MNEIYEFGPYVVDSVRRVLLQDGRPVSLSNKAFDVLVVLIRDRHRVVQKEELLTGVWPDTVVEENNLTVAVSGLRKALGEGLSDRRYIITVPGQGYRFAADVRVVVQRDDQPTKPVQAEERAAGRGRPWLLVAGGTALLAAVGILGYWRVESSRAPRVLNYTQITNDGADKITVLTIGSINPPMVTDGSRIYFTEQQNGAAGVIAQVSVTGGATALVPTSFQNTAVNGISPNGSDLLVYTWRTNELLTPMWVIPVMGGSPRRVGETTQDAAWLADGRIAYTAGHDLLVSKSDGTGVQKLVTMTGLPVWPRLSPNRKVFRFTQHDPKTDSSSLWEVSADGSHLHALLPGWSNLAVATGLLMGSTSFFNRREPEEPISGPFARTADGEALTIFQCS
jgi:DNA-binding winged helix-turn-helix (wHTH) protein